MVVTAVLKEAVSYVCGSETDLKADAGTPAEAATAEVNVGSLSLLCTWSHSDWLLHWMMMGVL